MGYSMDAADLWQSRLFDVVHALGGELKDLHKSNPWPEQPVLDEAMTALATELWDQGFSETDIRAAFETAVRLLPAYTAGEDTRP